jgi:hypothetical protein
MPYSTQADYRPIPPDAMGTLFDPERLKKGSVTSCYRMIRFYFAGADFKCPALG